MLSFPKNLRLTNSTTFWQHSQIQMALWWLRETSKKSYWCFFSKEKYEIGNEMVGWRHFIIYATKLKNWILFSSHKNIFNFQDPNKSSIFFREKFLINTVTAAIKTSYVCLQNITKCSVMFFKNLHTLEWINIIWLLPERPSFLSYKVYFSFSY